MKEITKKYTTTHYYRPIEKEFRSTEHDGNIGGTCERAPLANACQWLECWKCQLSERKGAIF